MTASSSRRLVARNGGSGTHVMCHVWWARTRDATAERPPGRRAPPDALALGKAGVWRRPGLGGRRRHVSWCVRAGSHIPGFVEAHSLPTPFRYGWGSGPCVRPDASAGDCRGEECRGAAVPSRRARVWRPRVRVLPRMLRRPIPLNSGGQIRALRNDVRSWLGGDQGADNVAGAVRGWANCVSRAGSVTGGTP